MADRVIEISDGEVIFHQGELSDAAYVIESGCVEVFAQQGEAEIKIANLEDGDLFGEMGVFDGRGRSASTRAVGPTTLRMIDAKQFHDRINSDPAFSADVMGKLIRRLRHTTEIMVSHKAALEAGEDPPSTVSSPPELASDERIPEQRVFVEDLDFDALGADDFASGVEQPAGETGVETHLEPSESQNASDTVSGPLRQSEAQQVSSVAPTARVSVGTVLIADFDGPEGRVLSRKVAKALSSCPGLSIDMVNEVIPPPTIERVGENEESGLKAASPRELAQSNFYSKARNELLRQSANTIIIGSVSSDADPVIRLHILTPWADDGGRMGGFSAHDRLFLPADFSDKGANLIRACVMAATHLRDKAVLAAFQAQIPESLQAIRISNTLSEAELAPRDHACNLLCYGNVAAKISGLGRDLDRMQDAVDAYNAAIESLSERDRVAFATAHLHKAVAMSTIAERTDNIIVLEKALAACRVAAERYDPKCETFGYITAQSRLGAIHYRLALRDGKVDTCRDGIQAFKAALAVCDRESMCDIWADVMNGLGQLLQLLGRYARKTDFVLWAIQVCRTALDVRTQERTPLGWARTQNNLCSAQVLLAIAQHDLTMLQEAIDGFVETQKVFVDHHQQNMASLVSRNRIHAEGIRDRLEADPNDEIVWWST